MKEIKAIVQSFMVEEILHRLEALSVPGLTLSEVQGWGRTRAEGARETVQEAGHAFARKVKMEIVVSAAQAPPIVDAIAAAARTGRPGDGKIFVSEVERVVRIRTGEEDEDGL
jgi:nitrogen regulatory protein P-II 1